MITVVHYKTKNDINGNPRRLYSLYDPIGMKTILGEGYSGSSVIRSYLDSVGDDREYRIADIVNIEVKQYKRMLEYSERV